MKKKLLVALASIAIAVPAFASPVAEGNFVLTAPAFQVNGLYFGGDYDDASFGDDGDISFAATQGEMTLEYFVADGIALGGLLGLQMPMDSDLDTSYKVGVVGTYYHDLGTGMMPFLTAGVSYASTQEEEVISGTEVLLDVTETAIILQPGVTMMLGENLAAYAGLDVEYTMYGGDLDVSGFEIGLNAGVKAFF